MKKESLLFSGAPTLSLSLKSSKELFSRAFDISLSVMMMMMMMMMRCEIMWRRLREYFFRVWHLFWSVFFVGNSQKSYSFFESYPLELLPPQSDFQGKKFLRKNFHKMLKLSSQNIDVVCTTERLSGAHNRAGPSFTNIISQTVV